MTPLVPYDVVEAIVDMSGVKTIRAVPDGFIVSQESKTKSDEATALLTLCREHHIPDTFTRLSMPIS
jgi:hypothetical protein